MLSLILKQKTVMILLAVSISGIISSCNLLTDKDDADKMLINYLFDDVEDAVSKYSPYEITKLLHKDFLHNGNFHKEQTYVWEERLLQFYSLSIENRNIKINDLFAKVSFTMVLRGEDETIISEEPSSEFGDMSYLFKEDGKWYLYGNQQYESE